MAAKPLIYFDNCALQRPFDDRSQLRIDVEADAILGLMERIEVGQFEMIASDALKFELGKMPDSERKDFVTNLLIRCPYYGPISPNIVDRAKSFEQAGIKPWDALHLATAVDMRANFFCTCDDALLKKANQAQTELTRVVSPLELIQQVST